MRVLRELKQKKQTPKFYLQGLFVVSDFQSNGDIGVCTETKSELFPSFVNSSLSGGESCYRNPVRRTGYIIKACAVTELN